MAVALATSGKLKPPRRKVFSFLPMSWGSTPAVLRLYLLKPTCERWYVALYHRRNLLKHARHSSLSVTTCGSSLSQRLKMPAIVASAAFIRSPSVF